VSRFQKSLVEAVWYLEPTQMFAGEELSRELAVQVEALQAEQRYQGRKLMGVDFRSFDRQSDDVAVVTVRETWLDSLYEFEGDWPSYGKDPIAQRGPYTLDATYTLEQAEPSLWKVMRAVYADGPPDWQ